MALLTEDEAKTKWCPLVRQLGTLLQPAVPGGKDFVVSSGSQNRGYQMGGPLDNCMCIASACMAWRAEVVSDWRADHSGEHQERLVGYCGAFGKPSQ